MMLIAIDHGNKQIKTAHQTFLPAYVRATPGRPSGKIFCATMGSITHFPTSESRI